MRSNLAEAHPVSTFALDVFWTAGQSGAPDLARHVAECAECRAYLDALAAPAPDAGANASLEDRVTTGIRPRARRVRVIRRFAQATTTLAFAAGVALFVRGAIGPRPAPRYVGVKGTPSVQMLVHRAGETAIWDGRSPVRAGDALAVRAACGDLSTVAVAVEDTARGGWSRLSETACPEGSSASIAGNVLPFTLVVDGESTVERIVVVMSGARLSDDELDHAIRDSERSARAWAVRFVLPEEP